MMRIAFLTSEFISELGNAGGLGNYLNRMTQALKNLGHVPEVFVTSEAKPSVIEFNGIRVQRVPPENPLLLKIARRLQARFHDSSLEGAVRYLANALALANAFERRSKEVSFDFVQCTNYLATGLFVKSQTDCPHLVRLSSKRDLWFKTDGRLSQKGTSAMIWLERKAVRKADIAYAPSAYLANRCQVEDWRSDVQVLRPPLFLETEPENWIPHWLPEKYLIHFGQIGYRKGSDFLAKALCQVWKEEPDLKMIWAGKVIAKGDFESCYQMFGEKGVNVIWLGAIPKPRLYALVRAAIAAVLPSRVDNLPNTAIESLMLKVPVIGSRGASIDEIVEPGLNGALVEIDDVDALAEAMLEAWRKESQWITPFVTPSLFQELEPKQAALNLIHLAGFSN